MNISKYLDIANIKSASQREEIQKAIDLAEERKAGLLWFKIKARLLKSSELARHLGWHNNRLIEVRPDLADYDIAMVTKVTCNGDNGPWEGPIGNDRPVEHPYTNPNPDSEDYKKAVASNYWAKGHHPRSLAARKAWYLRNAGEGLAYRKGLRLRTFDDGRVDGKYEVLKGTKGRISVEFNGCNGVWLCQVRIRLVGRFGVRIRKGFEVDNVFSGTTSPQAWFPLPGTQLRACVTWSTLLGKI